ncbi:carbohydrate kinase family protein [Chitinilyticum litopenaei]|uniref:carbohydrate kinase family protein n=1 Tax=Chitinilyticum litopenaei TaxID=1121276 RepID=UPI0003FAAB3C|nr:carbohydrate kinase [Chitinilyticum litopenaei]
MTINSLPRCVVFGEALTDFILQKDGRWLAQPGGACWNVARVVARQGVSTGFAGAVSQDLFGRQLFDEAAAAGIDTRFMQLLPHSPLLAMVPSGNPPQYFFVGDDSADLHFDPAALPAGWQGAAEVLHFGCISLARQPLAGVLLAEARAARAAGKYIAFDPNWRIAMQAPDYRDTFVAMAGLANFIKVSDEDLRGLYPALPLAAALAELRALAPLASILLTRGADGLMLLDASGLWEQPALPVRLADTVGCGDAVMGTWLAQRIANPQAHPRSVLHLAARCAALVAARPGAYAPLPAELSAAEATASDVATIAAPELLA